ncbi:hypothetical protein GOP47_0005409 [Adiantum capillus-veneris]|uniref:Uncharacterized protein n=1 Tax=Adiantum capillus-veneris TaxID=13818 RepID=A0A9D4ZP38_ADICA|nr:hypothetical protein GOP47_0005409 [Adiantum capillus-veneris]
MLKIRNTWSQKGDLQQQATTSGLALLAPIKCMSTRTTVQDQERGTGARKSVNEGAPTKNGLSNKERLDLKREFPTTNYRLEKTKAQHRMLLEHPNVLNDQKHIKCVAEDKWIDKPKACQSSKH